MAKPDDELARTATAHDGAPRPDPERPLGEMIGRYRLERELGAGGMGVVHVAFDPDLERRVALKVLRTSTSPEAAQRLQREARAMARLNHPNVVTVHEVGSANGRDYVAMELIEGETLAEWLRAQARPADQILDAFIQAGRGLAAAHAAGIVHRDFKPHNVLRAHSGLIEVTDFGLARETHAEAIAADPLVATLPVGASVANAAKTPSFLAGLTLTGSLLGTPAYMAPEQWTGGVVSPATDQFAFSVALWEALVGERPYRGPSVEELRAQILAGPSKLDPSAVPRRLRKVLLRGLAPDPKERWPSMDAMLAVIERRARGGSLLLAGGGAVIVAGAVIAIAMGQRGSAAPTCAAPAIAPSTVWNDKARAVLLDSGHVAAAKMLDADLERWSGARELACAEPIEKRAPVLACLDGVLLTMDAAVRGAQQLRDVPPIEIGRVLVDPRVCNVERAPRILPPTPQLREVVVARLREPAIPGPSDPQTMATLVARVADDPCASSYAHELQANALPDGAARRAASEAGELEGERCDDERVRADAAIYAAEAAIRWEFLGGGTAKKLRKAELAVQRVSQQDLLAELEVVRMSLAARVENTDVAIQRMDAALAGFAARGRYETMIDIGLAGLGVLQVRSTPADVAEVARRIKLWRELATRELGPTHDVLRRIEQADAWWAWVLGDVAGAHARLAAAAREQPVENPTPVRGRVVDAAGKPVAGATVVTGTRLLADSVGVAVALPDLSNTMRSTTTAADGTFAFPEAPKGGALVAQVGDRRSYGYEVADEVTLQLRPTSHVEGTVELHGIAASRVYVTLIPLDQPRSLRYGISTPVAADGTFRIDGAPRGKLRVLTSVTSLGNEATAATTLDLSAPSVTGLVLNAPNAKRVVHVIVRSTVNLPLPNAQVIIRPGTFTGKVASDLIERIGTSSARLTRPILESAPEAVRKTARSDDQFATMTEVPDGVATACGIALPDLGDPDLQTNIDHNLDKIPIRCVPIAADATVVTVEVPPFPRFD